jgi:phosphoenolpyruvate phosphomutase
VLEFMRRWRVNLPVVVVPTTYHTITAAELGMAGVKMVIYANHGLRAGISAVSEVFDAILRDGRTTGIEERIAPLSTVFDLQGMARLSEDEQRFVRGKGSRTRVVIVPGMARGGPDPAEASPGRALPALQAMVLQDSDLGHIVNLSSADGGPAGPDTAAAVGEVPADFRGRTVVITNDVFVDVEPLRWLTTSTADIAILVGVTPQAGRPSGGVPVSLSAKAVRGRRLGGRGGCLVTEFDSQQADAEFVGVVAFSPRGFTAFQEAAEKRRTFHDRPTRLVDLLRDLMGTGWAIRAMEITGGWAEVRTQEDLRQVSALVAGRRALRGGGFRAVYRGALFIPGPSDQLPAARAPGPVPDGRQRGRGGGHRRGSAAVRATSGGHPAELRSWQCRQPAGVAVPHAPAACLAPGDVARPARPPG